MNLLFNRNSIAANYRLRGQFIGSKLLGSAKSIHHHRVCNPIEQTGSGDNGVDYNHYAGSDAADNLSRFQMVKFCMCKLMGGDKRDRVVIIGEKPLGKDNPIVLAVKSTRHFIGAQVQAGFLFWIKSHAVSDFIINRSRANLEGMRHNVGRGNLFSSAPA